MAKVMAFHLNDNNELISTDKAKSMRATYFTMDNCVVVHVEDEKTLDLDSIKEFLINLKKKN